MVLLKKRLFTYQKNDKQNIVIKVCRCSTKKIFLEVSQNSQKKHLRRCLFLINLQAFSLQRYLKKDCSTDVFL